VLKPSRLAGKRVLAPMPCLLDEVWASPTHHGVVIELDPVAREVVMEWWPTATWQDAAEVAINPVATEADQKRVDKAKDRDRIETRHIATWPPTDPLGQAATKAADGTPESVEAFFVDADEVL
jgi:hypothetical protein